MRVHGISLPALVVFVGGAAIRGRACRLPPSLAVARLLSAWPFGPSSRDAPLYASPVAPDNVVSSQGGR
jgi:hypothetical protein